MRLVCWRVKYFGASVNYKRNSGTRPFVARQTTFLKHYTDNETLKVSSLGQNKKTILTRILTTK